MLKKFLLWDKGLLMAYKQAKELNLDKEFISILQKELNYPHLTCARYRIASV